jgi:sugar/nucleoside kinase (ribokinase family)
LDAQGFVRVPRGDDIILQDWADKEEGLALVDVLKVDAAEAEALTGLTDLAAAARTLRALLRPHGWREVVLTHAQGVLVHTGEVVYQAPWTARNLSGRTGRGDTCFASYLGARLSRDPETACRLAAAVTSLKMERPGPFVGTLAEVYQRMAEETLPPS